MSVVPVLAPVLVVAAYLLGSISFGLLVARREGVDLRTVGSGNIGATNVGRAMGKRAGRTVLLLDALKGIAPVLAARLLLETGFADRWTVAGPRALANLTPQHWVAATAIAAVLGHLFPIWHGFRGGKGVATTAGVMLVAAPLPGVAMAITYFAGRAITRRSSVGSLAASVVALAVSIGLEGSSVRTSMTAVLTALIFARHAGNIVRLVRGAEPPS